MVRYIRYLAALDQNLRKRRERYYSLARDRRAGAGTTRTRHSNLLATVTISATTVVAPAIITSAVIAPIVVASAAIVTSATAGVIGVVSIIPAVVVVPLVPASIIAVINLRVRDDRAVIATIVIPIVAAVRARSEYSAESQAGDASDDRGAVIVAATVTAITLGFRGGGDCYRGGAECNCERELLELCNHDLVLRVSHDVIKIDPVRAGLRR
jgi:hypothetical protein